MLILEKLPMIYTPKKMAKRQEKLCKNVRMLGEKNAAKMQKMPHAATKVT